MPTFVHGKGSKTYIDEFDLTDYFNAADAAFTQDTGEVTAYGASSRSYIPGLASAALTLGGMWSADTDGSDEELEGLLANATSPLTTVALSGGTIGNRAIMMKSDLTNYGISSPVADVVSVSADFQCTTDATTNLTYACQTGVQLTTGASIAFGALGNLGSVDNAASSASGGFAILHIPTNSIGGGVTTIKVQHSADNATFADLITFSTVAASTKTSELKAVSGTVNRYIRATAATAGSSGAITFMLSFARF